VSEFILRKTKEEDLAFLWSLLRGEEIGVPVDYTSGTSAVNAHDEVVGYIHVAIADSGPHVAPIAVFESWRGMGVGRALIEDAIAKHGLLKLVSNGKSNGFYEALGFIECSWEEVTPNFRRDCQVCPDFDTCGPKPYILTS
jgi:N-acetylglutamate synthase-like GNAT family acetyltransferase